MRPIERILVPVDFSEDASRALDWAIGFARKLGAEIELFHSYDLSPILGLYGIDFPGTLDAELRRAAEQKLEELALEVEGKGVRVRVHVVREPPSRAIAEHAEKTGADLIVMGARGLSGIRNLLFGSVAERTIQNAPCPVLTVKHEETA